jgi:hypothetical protein
MLRKQWITVLLISIFMVGCGGGSGSSDSGGTPSDNSTGNNNSANTGTVTQELSLKMTTESEIDRSAGGIILVSIRSIASDGSILQDDTVAASPAEGANSSRNWSLASDIVMDKSGGRVVVNAQSDGYIAYGATMTYDKPNNLEFHGKLAKTSTVTVDIPSTTLSARASGQVVDQYIHLRLTTDTATGQSRLLANKTTGVSSTEVNDLGIDIPIDEIPAGVTQLNAKMKGFDPSQADDNLYFPGEYADSAGNNLLSIAFNYVELTDQNGRNLGQATVAARTANRMAAKNTLPTIISRTIPAGSCSSVNDLGDANQDMAGLQIPVYTYNPNSGLWDLLGYGTVADAADVSPAAGFLDCDNVTYHLSIEVDNEDFLRSWWNLDYPLTFSEPTQLCAKVKLVDLNGDPVTGIWASLNDDDNRSFNTQYGYTDENGEINFTTVELNGNGDRSGKLRFWSYSSNTYRTETIQLSEECATQSVNQIVLQHQDLCKIEGRTVLDTNTSFGLSGTTIYAIPNDGISFDFKFLTTNQDGVFRGSVLCDTEYQLFAWPSLIQDAITFSVNSDVGVQESSDDGHKVVLKDILIGNMAPWGYLHMQGASDAKYHQAVDSVTAPLTAGTYSAQILAFDFDGHFPVSYTIQVKDSGDSVIQTVSGTVNDWSESDFMQDINIPADGDYSISFSLHDALDAQGESNVYIWASGAFVE